MTDALRGSWVRDARDLCLVAMAVFVVNIVIGILNGADVVEFNRDQILTHVHVGTVGWLTLAIVASAFLLFRASDRRLTLTVAVLVPVYVVAFYIGNLAFRAIVGTVLLLAVGWLLVWLWRLFLAFERTLPRLALLLGPHHLRLRRGGGCPAGPLDDRRLGTAPGFWGINLGWPCSSSASSWTPPS